MKKQIEEELKAKGYAIVEEDGKANLHLTSELNATLKKSQALGNAMVELMVQNKVYKVIVH